MRLILCFLGVFFVAVNVVSAGNLSDFKKLADRGSIEDSVCVRYGGTPIPFTNETKRTIFDRANERNGYLYYGERVYVMYGTESGKIFKTIAMNLCRF